MKIYSIPVGTTLPKPDFSQTDPSKGDYIKNKPDVLQGEPGAAGADGADGSSMLYYNKETSCKGIASISVTIQSYGSWTSAGFSGDPKVNDLAISASGQLFRVTSVTDTKVTMRYLIDLKGESGSGGSGEAGADGVTFLPSVDAEGNLSWSNDGGLENPQPVNIKGPRGEQGPAGADGKNGQDGVTPHIGENGNWWIGETDTGVSAAVDAVTSWNDLEDKPFEAPEVLYAWNIDNDYEEVVSGDYSGSIGPGMAVEDVAFFKISEDTPAMDAFADTMLHTVTFTENEGSYYSTNYVGAVSYSEQVYTVGLFVVVTADSAEYYGLTLTRGVWCSNITYDDTEPAAVCTLIAEIIKSEGKPLHDLSIPDNIARWGDVVNLIDEKPFLQYTEQTLTEEQQTQARANMGAAAQTDMDALGLTPIPGKNLFDVAAVTLHGWADYSSGKIEMYPDNKYIENYSFSDYMPVIGGESYTYSNKYSLRDGRTYMRSWAWYDQDKKYISGTVVNGWMAAPTVFTAPSNAAYIIFNFMSDEYDKENQFEQGETITDYEPYGSSGNLISGAKVPQSNIVYNGESILCLPKQYSLVVGDTFELFWKGIVKALDPEHYYIEAICEKGAPYKKRFIYTPVEADVGEHILKVNVYDRMHALLASGITVLSVNAKVTSPASDTVVLYVGDSLANGGQVPDEFFRRLIASDGTPAGDGLSNISFIGTCASSRNATPYEGYGGWTFNSYNSENKSSAFMWITADGHGKTDDDQHSVYADSNGVQWKIETVESGRLKIIRVSSSGTLPASGTLTWVSGGTNTANITYTASEQAAGNPFWNESTGAVDFATYAQAQGKTKIDYVYVLLGWNSLGTDDSSITTAVQTFITNVRASFPACHVVLLGLQMPAYDGLAHNYGASKSWTYYNAMSHVIRLNRLYAQIADSDDLVSFVQVSGQFDTEHNMPVLSRTVNVRNTATEQYQSNGVHPLTSGYYQIADACYRDFISKLQA